MKVKEKREELEEETTGGARLDFKLLLMLMKLMLLLMQHMQLMLLVPFQFAPLKPISI